ncbi:MAG: OB-fold nucleic acid binding domain-containing protein [Phycisphaeraceae bacterium]|nr:OB-fold nucleic acid binding domain-containing protein [Phycisphaeraceae bacterium]
MNTNRHRKSWGYGVLIGFAILGLGLMGWIGKYRNDPSIQLALPNAELRQMQFPPLLSASPATSKRPSISSESQILEKQVLPRHRTLPLSETPVLFKLARSPYPMAGEKFKKPLKPKMLATMDQGVGFNAGGELQAKPGQIIAWNHARQYVGQTVTIEGKVVVTHRTKTVCFLNFTQNWRGRFYVILFKGVLESWPQSPDKYFLNKTIRVTGQIKKRKGNSQLQVTKQSQIQVVD